MIYVNYVHYIEHRSRNSLKLHYNFSLDMILNNNETYNKQ